MSSAGTTQEKKWREQNKHRAEVANKLFSLKKKKEKKKKGNSATYPIHFQLLKKHFKFPKLTLHPHVFYIKFQKGLSALFTVIYSPNAEHSAQHITIW